MKTFVCEGYVPSSESSNDTLNMIVEDKMKAVVSDCLYENEEECNIDLKITGVKKVRVTVIVICEVV